MLFLVLYSCSILNNKTKMIIYPEYCGGCVSRNFSEIKIKNLQINFIVYFDTSDKFTLERADINQINYKHISNKEIANKFGDFANIVTQKKGSSFVELKTNETIEYGIHY